MLDITIFRIEKGGNPDLVRESQKARGESIELVDEIINLDNKHIEGLYNYEMLRKEINLKQKEITEKRKKGEDYTDLVKEKEKLQVSCADNEMISNCNFRLLQEKISQIGNIVHPSVPTSMDENNNEIIRTIGEPKKYDFKLKNHYEVMLALDMVDTGRGTAIAGHRGYFLKDLGVLLNQALINYSLAFLKKRNYTLLQPPFYMFKDVIAETVQLSDYDENLYKMVAKSEKNKDSNDEKYLIATSEQPISAYHRHETIYENKLPIKYCGLSTCFRKEAGAHGKDIQGIFRIHQFEKIEQFCLTSPEKSWEMFEEMISISEEFYQSLGLKYQIVNIVSGALNNAAAKKYDLEAWFPEAQKFRELVSCSNCTDYQSISMDIRLKRTIETKKKEFVHCLNSTLCATERTMCCIVENYQKENGLVIPSVLIPFLGFDFIEYKK